MADYQAALQKLIARNLVYRCFRTRREVAEAIASAPHGEAGDVFVGEALPPEDEAARREQVKVTLGGSQKSPRGVGAGIFRAGVSG